MRNALFEKTLKVIDKISEMSFVKNYYLAGGTALALQISHRLSEDLDFMHWQRTKADKTDIEIAAIKQELASKFEIKRIDILANNHVEIIIEDDVKLSFYAPEKRQPKINAVKCLNNLQLLDIDCIAALKMEVLLRRCEFRDYYDLYCILKNKNSANVKSIIDNALQYSEHNLKSKNLIGTLANAEKFKKSSIFAQMNPAYDISAKEIAEFMQNRLKDIYK